MKTAKNPFSYVVLRYMHDAFTREFVNVGVLLYVREDTFLEFRVLSKLDRVQALFPGLKPEPLRELLNDFAARIDELSSTWLMQSRVKDLTAETIAKNILPADDSALQWSPMGGGITEAPGKTLEEVFERLVMRHAPR